MGKLILLVGPMRSGKSAELLSRTEPYKVAGKKVVYLKPPIDTRNRGIESRLGARVDALTVKTLSEAPRADVYAIDEAHMFDGGESQTIRKWLENGSHVYISMLDTTYDGTAFPFFVDLWCLKPNKVISHKAVCEVCKDMESPAQYTQILDQQGVELTKGLPEDLTEDGRWLYSSRCRNCFVYGDGV